MPSAATEAGRTRGEPRGAAESPEFVPDLDADSIRVERLPREGRAGVAEPPALVFVAKEARQRRVGVGVALPLLLAAVTAFLLVQIGSSTTGSPSRPHPAPVRLTPAEQRAATAARARAAAIAQAKRDRGTDAELEDTIPAATPSPAQTRSAAKTTKPATPSGASP